ncbi:Asp-tRNA(Asn)/Glu-tRNA(Gln) amidotransferase subunit GatB [[Mycoplasma] falconis]|uniref:Aspartyl/glutamyl-tRNA(Asn/Gln) amidotransferase subunit B n=1 Tax=[Mycoplasma] falconis TaxID=92403 RepID=A0A501XBZ5_9BACT|nr:Asp-tRNA(Asn)/Glu-tRNA(Gln) amidotransferase subunit GatB [[Mycoplasma] falconis]TPE58080.1 Asp-tRNA(Asn)/Glu-tRNA(Gln) amidotransferase subunit GatB [[Mycoplasma] falconis]
MNKDWEIVIGIEIHLELNTKTKMFSPAPNVYGEEANAHVSNIDLAYPGSLPLVNSAAIIKAIKLAKALKMEIDPIVRFDRKNYFYPDLTKGYQITQQFNPIGKNGQIKIKVNNNWQDVLIERIHMEEDTAKSNHEGDLTYLNYNRSGVPLIEIVSNPVIHSAEEAVAYVEAIRKTAQTLNISKAKMNEGSMRVDVNISVRPKGSEILNTRVEIKNLNSLSNIEKAIEYEANYQVNKYLNNEAFPQETKRFDEGKQITVSMRSKSDAVDYKYFPDPNIPYIGLSSDLIDNVKIEELPYDKELRYIKNGLNEVQISQLINNVEYAKYFDEIDFLDIKKAANVFFAEVISYLNSNNLAIEQLELQPLELKEVLDLLVLDQLDKTSVKKILVEKQKNPQFSVSEIIKNNNLKLELMNLDLNQIIEEVLNENSNLLEEFTKNPARAEKFMMGQVMKKTKGKAKNDEVLKAIKERFN